MRIGVVAVQGSVREHVDAFSRLGSRDVDVVEVRKTCHMEGLGGVVIPGGESTSIGRLLKSNGLFDTLQRIGGRGVPIMGTCAGCVLLSSKLADPSVEEKTPLLGLMDMSAARNSFGRQRESFESPVDLDGIGVFPGVFIRAPSISRVWGRCRVVGQIGEQIVAAEQDNILALSFHPELSDNPGVHRYFLEKVQRYAEKTVPEQEQPL